MARLTDRPAPPHGPWPGLGVDSLGRGDVDAETSRLRPAQQLGELWAPEQEESGHVFQMEPVGVPTALKKSMGRSQDSPGFSLSAGGPSCWHWAREEGHGAEWGREVHLG